MVPTVRLCQPVRDYAKNATSLVKQSPTLANFCFKKPMLFIRSSVPFKLGPMSTQTHPGLYADLAPLGNPHQGTRSGAGRRDYTDYTGTCESLEGEGREAVGGEGGRQIR
jgi:hypothetical protein